MMVQSYFGIEKQTKPDAMGMAAAMRAMGMQGKAAKVATAPERDQMIFAQLREQAAKLVGGGRTV
jgi:hypothetical protein